MKLVYFIINTIDLEHKYLEIKHVNLFSHNSFTATPSFYYLQKIHL